MDDFSAADPQADAVKCQWVWHLQIACLFYSYAGVIRTGSFRNPLQFEQQNSKQFSYVPQGKRLAKSESYGANCVFCKGNK